MSIKNTFGIMNEDLDVLLEINHFTQTDVAILRTLQPLVLPKLGQLTEQFYDQLQSNQTTAQYLEGRIDALKATHLAWLQGLFTENFDQAYVDFLWNIGRVHAKLHIAPLFVAASMSYLRAEFPKLISYEEAQSLGYTQSELVSPILKMLDINQFVIDNSYNERLLEVTGIATLRKVGLTD